MANANLWKLDDRGLPNMDPKAYADPKEYPDHMHRAATSGFSKGSPVVETVERESEISRELKRLNDTVYTVSKRFEELEIRLAPVLTNVDIPNDSLGVAVPAPDTGVGQQIHLSSDELIGLSKQIERVLARLGV